MKQALTKSKFTREVSFYTVLILELNHFKPYNRILPDGFVIGGGESRPSIRQQEKKILQRLFDDWKIPFEGNLPGWRDDSQVYALHQGKLIGGVYLCNRNVFNDQIDSGQLHYAFMEPAYKGMGIYSVLFREAVNKAQSWDLNRIYLNSDRYILPDVYIRWGAQPWKTLPKASRLPQNRLGQFLWLIKLSYRNLLRRIRSL